MSACAARKFDGCHKPFGHTKFASTNRRASPQMKQYRRELAFIVGTAVSIPVALLVVSASGDAGSVSRIDRSNLVATFSSQFASFDGRSDKSHGDIWQTHFSYSDVNALGSRTLTSNKELQIYVDPSFKGTSDKALGLNPFRVSDGVLEITADRTPENVRQFIWDYSYISGMITTEHSFSQRYGLFEIRAKIPNGRGLWPGFWLLPTDRSWPPEIDVFEILGNDTTKLNTSWHSKETGKQTKDTQMTRIPDASADFHNYSVDWRRDEIKWYFDDVEVWRQPTPADMDKPMFMLATLGVGGVWPGNPVATTHFPAIFAIDWIRAFSRPE